jgi:predicted TPR repeat methyltransferase
VKPKQWSSQYAAIFKDQSVVKAYKYRPVYNQETIKLIVELLDDGESARVLDAACGTGFVARALVNYVSQIDAVDSSLEAI